MYHLRKIKVLLATCLLACTSLWAQDVKVTISSATSTSVHTGEEPKWAIDGDYSTFWHSGDGSGYTTSFPVKFTIKFASASHVDYVRYTPRTDSSNGNWEEVTVEYCSSTDGSIFETVGTFDLGGSGSSYDFYLNGDAGVTCGQVRFTINSGKGDWASAAEIEAYAYDTAKPAAFAQYFTDNLYTQLKSGVTSSNGIADADVKALVDAMLTNAEGYKKFRVGEYEPYMTTATVRNNLKTNSLYNNYENPTGIYLKSGESCIVAVSGINASYPVGLKIKDWYKSGDLSTYKLHNGLNYITATTEGNVFVDYYTDDFKNAPNVQMHFINAPVLGYWDQATMTNADWESMLDGPLAEEDDEIIIITRSKHAQTAYPVKQWKTYCPANVDSTMTLYQQVQWAERDIMGLEMYGRQVKNRQLFYADKSGSMFAGGDASVCGYGDLRVLVTPDAKVFDFWGVGHEWGHNNQMAGFHWTGCGETTNNIPASWAQFKFTGNRDANGNPTYLRLEDEVTGINDYKGMRGGRMQTYFEEGLRKGVQWQLQDGPDWHAETPTAVTVTGCDENGNDLEQVNTTWRHYDHFVKLAPFWQLNLWGTVAEKNPYIITKVIEAIRATDNYTSTYNTNGKQQINWMKLACEAAEMDLLPFFEKAGMLRPIHAYVDDYAKGWNIITEGMIAELKAHVEKQGYPTFTEEINYINGHNYHIYRDTLKLNVTAIQGNRKGDKVTIQHSVAQNAVAFETYNAQDELIRITMYGLGSDDTHSYTQVLFPSSFDESENAAYIMAVGYDGERQRVYQTYASEDEAKYGELGRILTGVEAMKALCNDTIVGYYKSSALTDLNAAYDIAKAVYNKKESAKYAAVYDMLNTEFMKVQNDATARVGIVEGNAYRLENKGYTGRYMSINSEKMIVGETTALTDAQKWYFEASDTEGYYYIKNKSTQTYPGNVETSTKLYADKTTSSEAHAYKLQNMGDGLWAFVGGTGLHQGSDVYGYGIVGWGADADASQWYITVVETNTNAEALNNLQVLVNKAEALIAEIEADVAYSTISTATAQSKVATAKNYIASGTYNASVYNELNNQYTALLNAKKSVDDAALDAKKLDLSTLIGDANSLIAQCGTVTYTPATPDTELALQANNSAESWYVSSNADQNTGGGLKDGDGIAALVDNNPGTYFHTRWGGTVVNEPHYIQVDMGQGKTIQEFVFSYTPRSDSPAPTAMTIYGINDESTEELATITSGLPAHNSGKSYTSSTINSGGASYRYLRFVVTGSAGPGNAQYGGQYFFGMMEFDITEMAKPESYTVTLGNGVGDDVTEELFLTAFKAVQEAQSVVDYANTEAQVNEAIEKLQAQYQALEDAMNSVTNVDYIVRVESVGNNPVNELGVIYDGVRYVDGDVITVRGMIDEALLSLEPTAYYVMESIVVDHDACTITVNCIDKSQLQSLIEQTYYFISKCEEMNYDPAVLDQARSAVAKAEEKYNAAALSADEYLLALNELQSACDVLYAAMTQEEEERNEKRTALNSKIDDANILIEQYEGQNLGDAITALIENLRGAVERALAISEDTRSTQGAMQDAIDNLTTKCEALTDASSAVADLLEQIELIEKTIAACGEIASAPATELSGAVILQTTNSDAPFYLSTNAQEQSEGPIANLIDDNVGSFFHSSWKHIFGEAHYLQVDMGEQYALKEFAFSYTTRDNGTDGPHPSIIVVSGSNSADGEFVEMKTIESGLPTGGGERWSTAENIVAPQLPYRYLRFTVKESTGDNKCKHSDDEYFFAMSEFNLTAVPAYYVESLNPNGSVTEEQLLEAFNAKMEAEELANTSSDLTALENMKAELDELHGELTDALNDLQLPVVLTTDMENPVLYTIKSKRGDTKVLQYDPAEGHMFSIANASSDNAKQLFYFTVGDTRTQVYVHPFAAGEQVLAADNTDDGAAKVFAREKGAASYDQWVFVGREQGYNLQPVGASTYFSNFNGGAAKMGFYSYSPDSDAGSLFSFASASIEGSASYHSLKIYKEELAKVASSEIVGGSNPGYYPENEADAYNEAYATATNLLGGEASDYNTYFNAYSALKIANEDENFTINMPVEGKFYRFVSAHTKTSDSYQANGTYVYADPADNKMRWNTKSDNDATAMWTIVPSANGKFAVENLHTGSSINTFVSNVPTPLSETAGEVSIVSLSADGQVGIKCEGSMMHAQSDNAIVTWSTIADGASAWRIVEVTDEEISLVEFALTISQYRHAGLYLNYAAEIPEGVKVYIAHTPDGQEGTILADELDGTILPARTAVIVKGNADTYNFKYTTRDYDGSEELDVNLLGGSAYLKYQQVEETGNFCCVFGQKSGEVGLYKNWVGYIDANGTAAEDENGDDKVNQDNGTHFKISANKIYYEYQPSAVAGAAAFRFRFNDETGIEGITIDADATIYDLYGRRVLEVVIPGLYIINGEKRYINIK